jgi:hypothetical protein
MDVVHDDRDEVRDTGRYETRDEARNNSRDGTANTTRKATKDAIISWWLDQANKVLR